MLSTRNKNMNEQQNIKIIEGLYAAFGRGDVPGIVAQLTDDIRWVSHGESDVPWSGDFSGKHRVPEFFAAIFQSVDVQAFTPQEWIAQGDTIVSLGEFGCQVRATGKTSRSRWVFIWKLRNGKICSYEKFDGPELAAAFR
jgi:ketosteroid isomerase-like protein